MKAQVSAPIELLIGVIILAMVLVVAYYTFDNMMDSQYNQKIKASLTNFANKLEEVYMGSPGTEQIIELDLSSTGPGKTEIESVQFMIGTESFCRHNVGTNDCYILVALHKIYVENQLKNQIRFAQALKIPTNNFVINYKKSIDASDICTTDPTSLGSGLTADPKGLIGASGGFDQLTCFQWKPRIYTLRISKLSKSEIEITSVHSFQ